MKTLISAEFMALADIVEALPEANWDTPSLCTGWRVREVVAHLTMPVRYAPAQFGAELAACDGDFTRLSNLVATRDSGLPVAALVGNLRDEMMHRWTPPGGGDAGALNHVVIHGLDITVPLGIPRAHDEAILAVLDDLTHGGTHAHFGFDLSGLKLSATDIAWEFGSGNPISDRADDLALLVCGRKK